MSKNYSFTGCVLFIPKFMHPSQVCLFLKFTTTTKNHRRAATMCSAAICMCIILPPPKSYQKEFIYLFLTFLLSKQVL